MCYYNLWYGQLVQHKRCLRIWRIWLPKGCMVENSVVDRCKHRAMNRYAPSLDSGKKEVSKIAHCTQLLVCVCKARIYTKISQACNGGRKKQKIQLVDMILSLFLMNVAFITWRIFPDFQITESCGKWSLTKCHLTLKICAMHSMNWRNWRKCMVTKPCTLYLSFFKGSYFAYRKIDVLRIVAIAKGYQIIQDTRRRVWLRRFSKADTEVYSKRWRDRERMLAFFIALAS